MRKPLHQFFLAIFILLFVASANAELSSNLQIRKELKPKTNLVTLETYVDSQGKPVMASDKGYAQKEYLYNMSNQLKEECFLDVEGNIVNSTDGYASVTYEYKLNKLVKTVYMDAAGQLVSGPEGYAVQEINRGTKGLELDKYEYDADGRILKHCVTEYVDIKRSNLVKSRSWYNDKNELIAGKDGYARVEYEYLKKKRIHTAYYNADGSLFFNEKDGYAEYEQIYDKGKLVEEVYRQGHGELAAGPKGYARVTYTYLQGGKETLTMYYNADGSPFFKKDGYCGVQRYQKNPQIVDEKYFVGEGIRGNCKDGYSRTLIRYNNYKQITTQSYYDEQDNLMCPEGYVYAKIKNTYTGRFIVKTEYFDTEEKPVLGPDGYAVVTYQYTKRKISEAAYYAEDGKTPVCSKDGYAKIKYEYDNKKRCISESYFDVDGTRKAINGEADELRFEWNDSKQKISESYWKDGTPANGEKGYHEKKTEYTTNNKLKKEFYYDAEGKLKLCTDGYAGIEKLYNSSKREMATLYYNESGELMIAPEKEYAYMLTIPENDKKALGELEQAVDTEFVADEDGNIPASTVYVEYYGTDRKLMNLASGYAYIIRQTDDQGRVIRENYYDKDGNKAVLKNGYDEIRQEYTSGKKPIRVEYYRNGNPTQYNDNYAAVEREYDETGNIITERYYGTDFQPAICKNGYEMIRKEYNEEKLVIKETYFNHNEQPMINKKGVYQTAYEYNENGKIIKENYFDGEGKPMSCPDGYAGLERMYNEQGTSIATLYYDEAGQLMLAPGKEYAYVVTTLIEEATEEGNAIKINRLEYYGTDRQLMNLSSGYASVIRKTDEQGRSVGEEYFDKEGNHALLKGEYDEVRQEYTDNNKKPSRIEYYLNGETVLRSDGYAAVEREYDEDGYVITEKYYDVTLQPAPCNKGYEMIRKEYNEEKRVSKEEYYDHNGQPMKNKKGVYQTAYEYNEDGKNIKETYFDADGVPMLCLEGYAGIGKMYNSQGGTIATLYYGTDGELILTPGREYAYIMTIPVEDRMKEDADNTININRLEYYDTERQLMNLSSGYASILRKTDEQGRTIGEIYFDKDGNRAVLRNEYDEIRQEYTDNKKPNRIEYYLNGEPVLRSDGYAAVEREYDENGNTINERYYDTTFQPISCKNGYEMIRKEYNEQNRVSKEAYYDHNGQPMINYRGVYCTTFEYNAMGKVTREAYYDIDGKQMANTNGYYMIDREYDEDGKKISETNYFISKDE